MKGSILFLAKRTKTIRMNEKTSYGGLPAVTLKWIAIAAMLIDHIAWAFIPTRSFPGQVMHIIGRLTAPIMCFFLAEGYHYTHNIQKYAQRLFLFALFSHIPFVYFELGTLFSFTPFNVLYSLWFGLLGIWAWDKVKNRTLCTLIILGLCLMSLKADWPVFDVLVPICFYKYRGNLAMQAKCLSIAAACIAAYYTIPAFLNGQPFYAQFFQFGVLLSIPILAAYNGTSGVRSHFDKWFFYIFYPAHLLLLALLKNL